MTDTSMGPEIVNYVRSNGSQILLAIAVIVFLRILYSIGKTRICLYRVLNKGLVCISLSARNITKH